MDQVDKIIIKGDPNLIKFDPNCIHRDPKLKKMMIKNAIKVEILN